LILDQLQIKVFVEQVKQGLAKEDEHILPTHATPGCWAAHYMYKPEDMTWTTYSHYEEVVGKELVKQGILKPDKRKKKGLPAGQHGFRVSRGWWNKQKGVK